MAETRERRVPEHLRPALAAFVLMVRYKALPGDPHGSTAIQHIASRIRFADEARVFAERETGLKRSEYAQVVI